MLLALADVLDRLRRLIREIQSSSKKKKIKPRGKKNDGSTFVTFTSVCLSAVLPASGNEAGFLLATRIIGGGKIKFFSSKKKKKGKQKKVPFL